MTEKQGSRVAQTATDEIEKLVEVRRVSKVVKGGRKIGFAAITVVGDGKGKVGYGYGKAREAPLAISKSLHTARKNMASVSLRNSDNRRNILRYALNGRQCASRVFMKPGAEGTGIIAGGAMRAVFEAAGVQDVVAKVIGSPNPLNVVQATIKALHGMQSPGRIANKRGLSVKRIFGIDEEAEEKAAVSKDNAAAAAPAEAAPSRPQPIMPDPARAAEKERKAALIKSKVAAAARAEAAKKAEAATREQAEAAAGEAPEAAAADVAENSPAAAEPAAEESAVESAAEESAAEPAAEESTVESVAEESAAEPVAEESSAASAAEAEPAAVAEAKADEAVAEAAAPAEEAAESGDAAPAEDDK